VSKHTQKKHREAEVAAVKSDRSQAPDQEPSPRLLHEKGSASVIAGQTVAAMETVGEELLQRYARAALRETPDAVFVLNEHFQLCTFNPAAAKVLGWEVESTVGRGCAEVLKCRNLDHMELCGTSGCPLVRVLQERRALPNEELIIGGQPLHTWEVSVSVTPVDIGQGLHLVFNARDVSALKMANRLRSNFVSMVSHELRTPLNSVHGFIDLLLTGHMGELNENQRLYLGYANEGVAQLLSLVEDILFMTRSDSGEFQIVQQQVNIEPLVQQVLDSMRAQAEKSQIILSYEVSAPPPLLYADPRRVKQVLTNLVGNAIKFTPPDGRVMVRVEPDRDDPQMTRIAVSDTGFGIAPEDQPHVFERFYQANHSMQSKMGGSGLGLTIARLIVEQHGGRIWFDTTPNKGTTFYFTLPLYTGALATAEV
jgi:PAS domain S-box-containing protein